MFQILRVYSSLNWIEMYECKGKIIAIIQCMTCHQKKIIKKNTLRNIELSNCTSVWHLTEGLSKVRYNCNYQTFGVWSVKECSDHARIAIRRVQLVNETLALQQWIGRHLIGLLDTGKTVHFTKVSSSN